jgi:hypothetical protein
VFCRPLTAAGLVAIPLATILLSFSRYAFTVFDHVVRGVDAR